MLAILYSFMDLRHFKLDTDVCGCDREQRWQSVHAPFKFAGNTLVFSVGLVGFKMFDKINFTLLLLFLLNCVFNLLDLIFPFVKNPLNCSELAIFLNLLKILSLQ